MELLKKLAGKAKNFRRQFYKIPYCVPTWGWEEHRAILRCLCTGRLVHGGDKEKLYGAIREMTGVRHVFGFNSGQEAISAALLARGVGAGDTVIMPSYCCESVAKAVVFTRARPAFCDIKADLNPDAEHVLNLLGPQVKAIIFPHLFGNPAAIDVLEKGLVAKGVRSKILLIDDAAQSFGARLNGRLLGTFGDAGIISFGPGKTMTASGGGLLVTHSDELAGGIAGVPVSRPDYMDKLRVLLYWLFFRRWRRATLSFFPYCRAFFKQRPDRGTLHALANVDAAIARCQLAKLERLVAVRRERKQMLDMILAGCHAHPGAAGHGAENTFSTATKYVLSCPAAEDDAEPQAAYQLYLKENGIELMNLYVPIHHDRERYPNKAFLPMTDTMWRQVLQVPLEPSMHARDFTYVTETVQRFFVPRQEEGRPC